MIIRGITVIMLALASSLSASNSLNGVQGVTRLIMGTDIANGIVGPAPASRVRVPPNECVVISGLPVPSKSEFSVGAGPFQWTKNGQPIPDATEATLTIPLATAADNGLYSISGMQWPFIANGIHLNVVSEGHLANYSNRVELAAGDAVAVAGFVVSGTEPKVLLVRGIGPSLAQFEINNPITRPVIQIFNADGERVDQAARIQPVWDFATWFTVVGAFPLIGDGYGEAEQLDRAFGWWTFAPGTYTAQLRDESQLGGTGLIEIYEVPGDPPTK